MKELTVLEWRGEPLKAVIKFDETTEYTIYSDKSYGSTDSFIKEAKFSLSEGNSNVNPLGVSISNTLSMQVYDENDYLTPTNVNSPYYGKTVNGVEIDMFISYDGVTFEPFGIWYTTNWDGGFSEGWHTFVNISACDRINTLGNLDLPELRTYTNVEVKNLVKDVFNGIGLSDSEFSVDPAVNKVLPYGIVQGSKIRDFMNNLCQLIFARVIVDREGIIRFVPSLNGYTTGNFIKIGPNETGSIISKNTNNINYNKIRVTYLEPEKTKKVKPKESLFSIENQRLEVGENIISGISFQQKVLSIEDIEILYDQTEVAEQITDVSYVGYQDGMQLTITVAENGPINNCTIRGEGITASTTQKHVDKDISSATVRGGSTFVFDTKQMMEEPEAKDIANNLADYLQRISRNVILNGTVLTPKLYVGDELHLSGTGTSYDAIYKVSSISLVIGENYSSSVTLLRLRDLEVENG